MFRITGLLLLLLLLLLLEMVLLLLVLSLHILLAVILLVIIAVIVTILVIITIIIVHEVVIGVVIVHGSARARTAILDLLLDLHQVVVLSSVLGSREVVVFLEAVNILLLLDLFLYLLLYELLLNLFFGDFFVLLSSSYRDIVINVGAGSHAPGGSLAFLLTQL